MQVARVWAKNKEIVDLSIKNKNLSSNNKNTPIFIVRAKEAL